MRCSTNNWRWGVLIVLIIAKVIATSASVASGVPGGIFAVLLVGDALGTIWAHALVWFGLSTAADTGSYALVGMAATTAASIHAPSPRPCSSSNSQVTIRSRTTAHRDSGFNSGLPGPWHRVGV
jgi:hypothetical protein